jgi:hypothetical protein
MSVAQGWHAIHRVTMAQNYVERWHNNWEWKLGFELNLYEFLAQGGSIYGAFAPSLVRKMTSIS